ncbi:type I restriction enzyme HsdR N-terminal domain-containing protein [Peribacillus simplex]|uniref:type I restriction enzyme HsdR N-terminal domain-containing protein n=1 Tax=Peribacillus simplex TaxID=1478 RepID=UPI00203B3D8A|nr:type I restriction enzyme HsdR N-terminal domain-containing protein [Peribacillus simplex]MCM3675027.1 type I restriction enzyme HsdR N-terminal domain-containing protein [Peribacillus simplex]
MMKEAEILNKVLLPTIIEAGFENDEVSLNYLITSNVGGGEIRFRPDIVLFDDKENKKPVLVIELKSSLTKSVDKLNNAVEQALFYSSEIGVPIFAITDGIKFYLYSSNKLLLEKIDSIESEYQTFQDLLSKENLNELIRKVKMDKDEINKVVGLEEEWLEQIDEEILAFNDVSNEVNNIGAKVVGYLGEKVFEKFCIQEGISFRKTNLDNSFDFIVGSEKVEVKAILVDNKLKRYKFSYNPNSLSTIIYVAIYVDLNDDALLGYNFKQAEIVGYVNEKFKNDNRPVQIIRQTDLLPIKNWIDSVNGGVSK